jgi:lysophospholipase L1-like esterase
MDKENLLESIFAAATAVGAAETVLRLKRRNEAKARFQRERWTVEKTWERFDLLSGWELNPGYTSDEFDINSHGYRGEELVRGKTFRIVCLGDSVTFGQPGEKNTYPQVLQKELAKKETSLPVEVVNAGINGQFSYNMIFRIGRIMKLRPDVILILAGWNDLFFENIGHYRDNRYPYASYWDIEARETARFHLLRLIREKAGVAPKQSLPLSYSPDEFVPFNFEYNLNRIISRIQSRRVKTAVITLPKLIPDDPALITPAIQRKTILPDFIDHGDIDSFLKIYNAYDAVVKNTAEENNIPVFDAEHAFAKQKRPRNTFFEDTCHMTSAGAALLGKFVARSLLKEGFIE